MEDLEKFGVNVAKGELDKEAEGLPDFVADTETTQLANYKVEGMVRVILWGIRSVDNTLYFYGYDGQSLLYCLEYLAKNFKRSKVYFHNLKFDWSYIVSDLFKNEYSSDPGELVQTKAGHNFKTHPRKSFDVMRSARGAMYQATIYVTNKQYVTLIDSMKFYPGPLSTYGDLFGVKKLYGDFDYTKYRPLGYKFNYNEMLYFNHDIEILRRMIRSKYNAGYTELTRPSAAYNSLIYDTLKDFMDPKSNFNYIYKMHQARIKTPDGQEPLNLYNDFNAPSLIHSDKKRRKVYVNAFNAIFPSTSILERSNWIDAYSGGFVWADTTRPKIGKGVVYDCNSEYPAAMKNSLLPFGDAHDYDGKPSTMKKIKAENYKKGYNTVYILKFRAKFKLKESTEETRYFPTLPKKYSAYNNYITSSEQIKHRFGGVLTLTNFDLKEFLRNYDVEAMEFIHGWWWLADYGLFYNFINDYAGQKVKATKGRDAEIAWLKNNQDAKPETIAKHQALLRDHKLERSDAKRTLNSSYGKFCQSPVMPASIASMGTDGIVRYDVKPSETADEKDALKREVNGRCLPVGIFITANARQILFKALYVANWRCHYIDTDSIHIEGTDPVDGMECDQAELGKWKIESKFDRGHYLRPKCYEEWQTFPTNADGKAFNKVTLAGFDAAARAHYFKEFGHLEYGTYGVLKDGDSDDVTQGAQTSRQVAGGTLLIRNPKKITEQLTTGDSQAEINAQVNISRYHLEFWSVYYNVINGTETGLMDKLNKLIEWSKSVNIYDRLLKENQHVQRDFIMKNMYNCIKYKAFLKVAKQEVLGYNTDED